MNSAGQAITGAVNKFAAFIFKAGTWTPHPGNAGNWFQNPQNGVWHQQWKLYKTIARPLAFLLMLIATGLYYGLGSKSLHVMDPATEQKQKRHVLVGWIMLLLAWPLGGLYLGLTNGVTHFFLSGITTPSINSGLLGSSLSILVLIAVAFFEFWTVILMVLLFGLRIAGLVAFLPFLPVFFALRAIPIKAISNSADGIIHLWTYLVLLPLPVAALLTIGFSSGLTHMIMKLNLGGALMVLGMHIGALIGAILVPFAMYEKMKEHGLTTGVAGGNPPGDKIPEAYQRQRETAARRQHQYQTGKYAKRNFNRGRRGQLETSREGQRRLNPQTRAHRVGSIFNRGRDD